MDFRLATQTAYKHENFDGTFCWFQPDAASIDGQRIVMLLQRALLSTSDYYSGLYVMHSANRGETWMPPEAPPELGWQTESDGMVSCICDVRAGLHRPTGKLLIIGHATRYRDGKPFFDAPRGTAYSSYDVDTGAWQPWDVLDTGDVETFFNAGSGCCQWIAEPDGTLLVPMYFAGRPHPDITGASAIVFRCIFDGETLRLAEKGDALELDVPRGLAEPSITYHGGRYWLTLRNDEGAYWTHGEDGLHWAPIQPWTFDDGEDLGSYNTQQHWISHSDALFLSYTRRAANNHHMAWLRHRAPLFVAQVDTDRGCVIRETERIVVPERGAGLGNFGVTTIDKHESWVTVAEHMNPKAREHGADNSLYITRLRWERPNTLVPRLV